MKKTSTIFLQIVVVLIGIGVLAFMLWLPQTEGRNVNATQFEIYFTDPFLAYMYLGSIPFFVALYQAFMILGGVGRTGTFSQSSVRGFRIIKYCALTLAGAIVAADAFLMIMARQNGEDAAGAVALGMMVTFVSIVIAAAAGMFERSLRSLVERT
jgi:hypothetical protein